MPKWIVIYDDLTTFDSDDGTFEEAPAWGTQAIAYLSKATGWSMCTGDHFIQLPDGEFLSLSESGFIDYAANVLRVTKVGRMISREEFGKAVSLATSLMNAEKTAHFKGERKE